MIKTVLFKTARLCYNQGKEMDSSVALHNIVAELDPPVFEVANLEERDVVFEDAPVDVYMMFWTTMMSGLLNF